MAPALNLTPQVTRFDLVKPTEKLAHRRRTLGSVRNIEIHMEDKMGVQQPNMSKDSQEIEQLMVELESSEADLLQAVKTLETGGESFPTNYSFELGEANIVEGDLSEAKVRINQSKLENRCALLLKRVRIIQARSMGNKISEEAVQSFEKSALARRDGAGRPGGVKALIKRLETTAALQASAASNTIVGPEYYSAGTSGGDAAKSSSLGIPASTLSSLESSALALRGHLSVVQHQLDSDATECSSGAESNDEAVLYNNPHQKPLLIEKRALWRWQRKRASVASRWCWLQVQVQELEYKIRQHSELHKQIREAKGPVEFEDELVAYKEPGVDTICTCARIRPLRRDTFKERMLMQTYKLQVQTSKAIKPSSIRCSCLPSLEKCVLCKGRIEPTEPAMPMCTLPSAERLARVDPAYHAVLSDLADVTDSVHMSALMSRSWFQSRYSSLRGAHHSAVQRPSTLPSPTSSHPPTKTTTRHIRRLKRGRPPLSRKVMEREKDDDTSNSGRERSRGRSSTESRLRRKSYDIDNIVIPQSIAANTRPEILTYKEIITPKWRVMEVIKAPLNNGVSKSNRLSTDSEDEDISEEAVLARHIRAETQERCRYSKKRRNRRTITDEVQSDSQTNVQLEDELAPQLLPMIQQNQDMEDLPQPQTVRPYSPRLFPLPESMYQDMLAIMPDSYQLGSPVSPSLQLEEDEVNDSSTLSPMSPLVFDGDDPDDKEWNPSNNKIERRKSAFR